MTRNFLYSVLLLILVTTIVSCEKRNHFIYYKYNGVTITRYYEDAESRFYYGYFTKESDLPDDYIYGKYPGRDGLMDGIIVFKPGGKVEIEQINSIYAAGNPKSLLLKSHVYPGRKEYLKKIEQNENIVQVYSALSKEKELNSKNKSKVLVIYPK